MFLIYKYIFYLNLIFILIVIVKIKIGIFDLFDDVFVSKPF